MCKSPVAIKDQKGVALIFVVIVILSLALLVPTAFRQTTQSYFLFGLDFQKQQVNLLLNSLLDMFEATAYDGVVERKHLCDSAGLRHQHSVLDVEYQVSILCQRSSAGYVVLAEAEATDSAYYYSVSREYPSLKAQ